MDRNLVTISKFLAKHLRHAPDALDVTARSLGCDVEKSLVGDELAVGV